LQLVSDKGEWMSDNRAMDFSKLTLQNVSSQPLYSQLLEVFETAIESGNLAIGTRLPSERALAEQLQVSRTTVISAYRELEARGLIHSHVGRGTFVCAGPEPTSAPFAWRGKVSRAASLHGETPLRMITADGNSANPINFAAGSPAIDIFPVKAWQQLMEQALNQHPEEVLGNGPTHGLPLLRRALAGRFQTKPERILVLAGSQHGIDLIGRCLLDPGDAVIIDRPCYVGAIQNFRAAGAHLIGWDIARADMGELEELILRYRPKLIFTNPTFQNPTGRLLSLQERRELLKLAVRYRVPVVEDDPYRETYFETPPPPSLYQLDEHNIVIYLSTFSKVLAPGLRLAWLTAAESVVDQLAVIKQRANLFTEGIGQYALAEFLQRGLYDDHLARLRGEHGRRQYAFQSALKRYLPANLLKFTQPAGGLYFWCRVHRRVDAQQWAQQARARGVSFAGGEYFYADSLTSQEARFCFTWLPPLKIEEGVKRLAAALPTENRPQAQGHSEIPLV
jgi:2-aminoadipate transaminase